MIQVTQGILFTVLKHTQIILTGWGWGSLCMQPGQYEEAMICIRAIWVHVSWIGTLGLSASYPFSLVPGHALKCFRIWTAAHRSVQRVEKINILTFSTRWTSRRVNENEQLTTEKWLIFPSPQIKISQDCSFSFITAPDDSSSASGRQAAVQAELISTLFHYLNKKKKRKK